MADDAGKTLEDEGEENGLVLDDDESKELQEVFSTVFPQYLVPLEELVGQLLDGQSSPEIIDGLRGALTPLVSAAGTVGVTDLKSLLEEFKGVIDHVGEGEDLDDETRDKVIDVFYRLKEAVQKVGQTQEPEAAPSDFVARLSAIEGVNANALNKMLAAGVSSAEQVAGATVDEIAAVTGLPEPVAQRIHQNFGGRMRKPKKPGGSSHGQSGGAQTHPAAKPSIKGTVQDLQSRVALVGLLRDRIRLEDALERDRKTIEAIRAEADELSRALIILKTRIHQRGEELAHEEELTTSREAALSRLRGEIHRTRAGPISGEPDNMTDQMSGLEDRLEQLRKRITTGTG